MSDIYVVTGATGNTGKPVALALLKAGKKVRAISRSAANAADLEKAGAEIAIGSPGDKEFLTNVFDNAHAVYAMIPPNFQAADYRKYQNEVAEAIAGAVKVNKVPYVVTLSSIGAHLEQGSGLVLGLADMEKKFNQISGLNVLHLRPGYFMENLFGQIDVIKNMGIMGSAVKPDLLVPMVTTTDIAEVAANRLIALDFSGREIQYILGAGDVTFAEAVQKIGQAISRPELKYVQFPYEDAEQSMINSWGVTESAARAFTEFTRCLNEGRITEDVKRDVKSTTPTSLDLFSEIFARIYNQ